MTPDTKEHLSKMHCAAITVEALLRAMDSCLDEPARRDLVICLVSGASEVARELVAGLDSVNLPKGDAS